MDDRELLEQMAESGEDWVSRRARVALELADLHTAGELSDEEFAELAEDLVRADQLDAEASDLETKAALVTAVYGVAQVI